MFLIRIWTCFYMAPEYTNFSCMAPSTIMTSIKWIYIALIFWVSVIFFRVSNSYWRCLVQFDCVLALSHIDYPNSLRHDPTKCSNTLKRPLVVNCLSVSDHFLTSGFKGLIVKRQKIYFSAWRPWNTFVWKC